MKSSTQPTKPTKAKPAKVLYPEIDQPHDAPASLFWLAAYFRDAAEIEALQAMVKETHRLKKKPHIAFFHALYGAINSAQQELKTSLGCVIDQGQLMFAHPATTIFNKAVPA